MITIGMVKIGEVTFAENQSIVEKENNNVSKADEATPKEYFEIEITNENLKEAKIKKFKQDVTPAITEVVIPETIDGYTVTAIGNDAFMSCDNLKFVNIPDSVSRIADYAFAYCALESIEIPDTVTYIGSDAFNGCEKLKSIKIPDSVRYIGSSVFNYCTSLESIIIPSSVTNLSRELLRKCTSLRSVAIPNTITNIENNVFDYCPMEELVIVCQDSDSMDIPADSPINSIPKADTNVYRIAVTHYDIQADENEIKAYEYMGRTVSLDNVFKLHMDTVVRRGMTGNVDNGSPDINAEDYLDKSITYTLQGSSENGETSLEGHELYIGKNETSNELKIEAVKGTVTKTLPIKIVQAESISIKEAPKSIYDEGQEYKPEDLVITILYEDHRQEDIKYDENKDDFSFKYNELSFDTKEQEITYGRFQVTHSLTIYGNKTLRESNVEVKGMFTEESILEIKDTEIDSDLKDKEIIASYDINVVTGSYRDALTISFDVGNEYNGKTLNIRHNGTEEFEEVVSEGKVTIEVDHLSPFIIYTEKVVEEPETPIIPKPNVPDESKPVIKPTPDTPVQTKPNQPQKDTVSTEDNNHLLLWGVLGIVGMSVGIMSIKKKSRIKSQ